MKHNHENHDQLTTGCDECLERVRGDQFWAEFKEQCNSEDVEFGLSTPVNVVFAEWEDDPRVMQYARFIPPALLEALLYERSVIQSDGWTAILQETAVRLERYRRDSTA